MSALPHLSRIASVPVRDVWAHEAHHFTQWLLVNADVLSDVLGMDLELSEAERRVGGFALDLIGTDLQTGATVIVENQLEGTDHSHLGQLLTYAGGTDPATIVWCAAAFRDEHRAALDWLNEHTEEGVRFFGVEIAAVRIGDSPPAPLFRLVAQPNDWTKRVHTENAAAAGTRTPRQSAYEALWQLVLDQVHAKYPSWTSARAASRDSWITMPFGTSGAWYAFVCSGPRPRVELYFGSSDADENQAMFDRFLARREYLETGYGESLDFQPLPGRKACRIAAWGPEGYDVLDLSQHGAMAQWFLAAMDRFRTVTQEVRRAIGEE
ncbi:DUF4268 domain-containing protein [Georgenia soli]|nr:DUF4268 domain-containing protein [Georgenia soli]